MSDALKFPIYASSALLFLYFVFKNIEGDLIVFLFKINFSMMALSSLGGFLSSKV